MTTESAGRAPLPEERAVAGEAADLDGGVER
jgi:hypothetical protein